MIRTTGSLTQRPIALRNLLLAFACLCPPQAAGQVLAYTIDNYPRYATSQLTPEQSTQMRTIARAIAGTLYAGGNVAITITGHADFDAQGRDFETHISEERARGAEAALRTMVREELGNMALPTSRADSVDMVTTGVGTLLPVFAHPANEDQRLANRRVVFVFTVAAAPPPPQQLPRCKRVMAGTSPPGPARRMTCVCNLLASNPSALDYTYDYRSAQHARTGAGNMANWTPQRWHAFAQEMTNKLRRDITAAGNSNGDDGQFAGALRQIDDNVGRSISDFMNTTAPSASAPDLFERVVAYDISKRMMDPAHVYSCYSGYSRATRD